MTSRLLPPEEWDRLAGTEMETIVPYLQKHARVLRARVLVVEDAGVIVGCLSFFPLIHAEGVWVDPAHRGKASVARRLLRGMRETVRDMGGAAVNTAAISDEMRHILNGLGAVKLPGTHYALRIEREICHQQ